MAAGDSQFIENETERDESRIGVNNQPEPTESAQTQQSTPKKLVNFTINTFEKGVCLVRQLERNITAADLLGLMRTELGIGPDLKDMFSLWIVSDNLKLQLKLVHQPVKIIKKWKDLLIQYTNASKEDCQGDKPQLYFRRSAFLPVDREEQLIEQERPQVVISLLYHEAVYNVKNGQYPLKPDEVLKLAGYQCAIEKGEYCEEQHKPEKMREEVGDFLPSPTDSFTSRILGSLGWKTQEKELSAAYQSACGSSCEGATPAEIKLQRQLAYLKICQKEPYYGSVFFRGQVERKTSSLRHLLVYRDRPVIVAINKKCIHVFDCSKREIILSLSLSHDLLSWDFQPATEEGEHFYSSLWLGFKSTSDQEDICKRLQIFSRQAPLMDAMISRCVDELSTDAQGSSLRSQNSDKKENKLICETYNPETGEVIKKSLISYMTRKSKTTPTQENEFDI